MSFKPHRRSAQRGRYFSACAIFFTLLGALGCGGDITFPQGPTSGADDISNGIPRLQVEMQSTFDLQISEDPQSDVLILHWTDPTGLDCASFQVVLVETPDFSDPTFTAVRLLSQPVETDLRTFSSARRFFWEQSQEGTVTSSALVVCVLEGHKDNPDLPYPRSDFVSMSRYFNTSQ